MPITVDERIASKYRTRRIPLRKYMIAPFILFFAFTVIFFCWFSYVSALNTVNKFQRALSNEISSKVWMQLDRLFSAAVSTAKINSDYISIGRLDPSDRNALQKQFETQLKNYDFLTLMAFGYAGGEYTGAARDKNTGILSITDVEKSESMTFNSYEVGPKGSRGTLINQGPKFDATQRPWYVKAAQNGRLVWYPAFKYSAYSGLGMGVSAPVYNDSNGTLKGVVVADISLNHISEYMKLLNIGEHGFAFITEPNGKLIASTLDVPAYYDRDGQTERYSVENYPDGRVSAVSKLKGPVLAEDEWTQFYNVGNSRYLLNKRVYRDDNGLKLDIWAVTAEQDFVTTFNHDLKISGLIILFSAIIGLIVIQMIANHLAQPIEDLSSFLGKVADGNLDVRINTDSHIAEISQLSESFSSMMGRVKNSFSQLEEKIQERTEELNKANVKLRELAITDELTGVANRRYFNEMLSKTWAAASRSSKPVSLIMIDVDFFKKYNDRYGHPAGDECLEQTAKAISSNAKRITDVAARYGGEEFVIILPDTDEASARKIAEKIRASVEQLDIAHELSPYGRVTVSIGLGCMIPDGRISEEELLRSADKSLYDAKFNGRNRVR